MDIKFTVLLVDDNEVTTKAMTKLLMLKGYDVMSASTVEDAKKIIDVNDSLTHLLCDFDLDGENGLEAAGHFNEKFPLAPILILTGYKDFLRKPEVADYYANNVFVRNLKIEYKPIEQNQLFQWFNEVNKKIEEDMMREE